MTDEIPGIGHNSGLEITERVNTDPSGHIAEVAGDRLKSFIERIERLDEEKKALQDDIKEVFAEAKGTGFDTAIMRLILKIRKMDKDDLDEQETLLDVYKRALGMLPEFE